MVSVNNVQNVSNIRIRISEGGLRLYDVVTELDKKIRRLFIMNLKKKFLILVGLITISLPISGITHSETNNKLAKNDLPYEYSIKQLAKNDLPYEYSVKKLAKNDLPYEYSVKQLAKNDLPYEYIVIGKTKA